MNRFFTSLILMSNISFAVLMPFSSGTRQDDNNLEFYSGVLMATKTWGDKGLDITVKTYDLNKDMASLTDIDSNDFVIGPIRYEDIGATLGICSIPLISPLDPKVAALAATHPNLMEVATQQSDQYRDALEWAKEETALEANVRYIVVSCDQDSTVADMVRNLMNEKNMAYHVCKCGVQGDIENWDIFGINDGTGVNVAILAINNEAVLNNAIRNLGIYNKTNRTLVFTGSKVRSYESIPVENLHKAEVHALCPYYIDYKDPETKDFIYRYRALYNSEPSQYAFQGYDLACYMLKTCSGYGREWFESMTILPAEHMLQTSFKFNRIENGGLVNTAIRRVLYGSDYKVRLVK